jgi:hypothetical protein
VVQNKFASLDWFSEINGLMTELATEFANLVENDARAEDIKNELSRLSFLRYQLDKEAMVDSCAH